MEKKNHSWVTVFICCDYQLAAMVEYSEDSVTVSELFLEIRIGEEGILNIVQVTEEEE